MQTYKWIDGFQLTLQIDNGNCFEVAKLSCMPTSARFSDIVKGKEVFPKAWLAVSI